MRRLLVSILLVGLMAGCAAPTSTPPAAATQAQVPVTGPTATPMMAMPASPTPGMMMQNTPTIMMAPSTMMAPTMMAPTMMAPTMMAPTMMAPTMMAPTMEATEANSGVEPTEAPKNENEPTKAPDNEEITPIPGSGSGSTGGYTVQVGAENVSQGATIEAFFPASLHIHVGDTVTWKQNANEIHTVTFLAGQQTPELIIPMPNAPQGAVMMNPLAAFPAGPQNGQYDGMSVAGSGIMGKEQGQANSYSLTFTKAGTYNYVCVVHNMMKMTGTIVVDPAGTAIPTPEQVAAQAQQEITQALAKVPAVIANAQKLVKPDVKNADGTTTHTVMVGYEEGQVDLMSFFPANVAVRPGDTVTWQFSPSDMAPHTITFLNGAEEPAAIKAIPQPSGPPILTFDPAVALPQNAGQPLSSQGIFSSGVIDPAAPGPHSYSIKIGSLTEEAEYECLLHDTEGMKGTLTPAQ